MIAPERDNGDDVRKERFNETPSLTQWPPGEWTLADAAPFAGTLSLAHLLLLAIVGLGAVLRLTELGRLPLSTEEALHALAGWQVWRPESAGVFTPVSSLFVTATALLSQVLGAGDAALRLLPALAGTVTVALPWLLRRRLGTIGALGAALILAFSPTLSAASRTAEGQSFAALALLLLLVGWLRYRDGDGDRWLLLAAGALGLGLNSDPIFYGGLVTLVAALWLQMRYEPGSDAPRPERAALRPDRALLLRAGVVTLLLFSAGNAFFLLYPAGGALAQWLGRFGVPDDLLTWLNPLLALGRYELLALLAGGAGLLWISWQGSERLWLFIFWFTGGLVLALLQDGAVSNVILLVLPGALLGGAFLQRVFERLPAPYLWPLTAVALVLGAGAFVNLARYVRITVRTPNEPFHLVLFVAAALLLVATLVLSAGWSLRLGGQAAVLTALGLLLFYSWGSAWWLSHDALNDPRERWVETGTDPDVRQLLATVRSVSKQTARSERSASLFIGVESPVLRWYLRDFEQLQLGDGPPTGSTDDLIITEANAGTLFGSDYVGGDFALARVGLEPAGEDAAAPGRILRWWLYHESEQELERTFVVLWVRADLVNRERD